MFKLESYITPILLSYVDKYIKNFRPEDSQVSLWGGDASFHNLDLRLEVLEQELQLPFSFVSGHIHELLIHVPWTKLASEPIHITINTIECILKLRGDESNTSDTSSLKSSRTGTTGTSKDSRRRAGRRQDMVAPPGYIQSLVNKIVSNITIVCNNLILKYVEEDIVLSVNIRTVTLQSANEKWEPSFTEQSHQVIIRKLIDLTDLTICLDKRTSSGKIESYQEPLLYRCPMVIHLLRSFRSMTAKQASTTRVDVKCGRMDFSITEQQVPMVMRLVRLALALHSRELRPDEPSTPSEPEDEEEEEDVDTPEDESLEPHNEASWAGWAWSFVPSLLPTDWDEDWSGEQQIAYKGHTFHSGVYISQASISVKYSEQAPERGYYVPKKVKFVSFLSLSFKGCYMEMISHGVGWMNVQVGVSQAVIEPRANCFCGVSERPIVPDAQEKTQVYLNSGIEQDYYLADSLFDPEAPENKGKRKGYSNSWDYHLGCYTESSLLARTAAFAFDYLYVVELPDDYGSEQLSELGSDLEYSNLAEKVLCRIVFGQTVVNICSGLLHRIQMIRHAASFYDYSPYTVPKPELSLEQLPPASSDDFEALNENIPLVTFRVTLFQPAVHFHLIDHPNYDAGNLFEQRKRKKSTRHIPQFYRRDDEMPVFSVECQCLDASFVRPMYPRRLVTTACKLPLPPPDMFHACHKHVHVKAVDFKGQLMMNAKAKPVTVLMPCVISYDYEMLIMTEYWVNTDLFHYDRKLSAESITIILTNPKLLVISYILQSLIVPGMGLDIMFSSSLLYDAAKDIGIEFLELNVEVLRYRHVTTPITRCNAVSVGVVRAFVLLTSESVSSAASGPQQALVLSGPAVDREKRSSPADDETTPLLGLTFQLPLDPGHQAHPPLLICNLRELHVCVDPLLWRWLRYGPYPVCGTWDLPQKPHVATEPSGRRPVRSSVDNGRRQAPEESVHSSSDHQASKTRSGSVVRETVTAITSTSAEGSTRMEGWRSLLLYWFPVWRGLVISGDIAHCVVYLPTASLSAVGVETIQEALDRYDKELLVIKLPYVTLRSAAQKQGLYKYTNQLPVTLPDNLWSSNKVSFPWNLAFVDFSCHTIHSATRLDFIKPVSANATIGISTKYHQDEVSLMALNFYVHVDTSRVKLAASDVQMILIALLLTGLLEVSSAFTFHNAPPSDGPAIADAQQGAGAGGHSHASPPPMYQEGTISRETSITHPSHKLLREMTQEVQSGSLICDLRRSNIVNLTANMQWTLARLSLHLYTDDLETLEFGHKLKLEFEMDDIFTSLDLQEIYMKVKCKVAAASILHYRKTPKRPKWKHGPYLGLVMRANDELSLSDTDDNEFLCMTFTRARCKNTQSRWGIMAPQRKLRRTSNIQAHPDTQLELSEICYISEVVLKLQPVDFVLSPQTMTSFMTILNPLNMVPERQRLRSKRSEQPNLTQLFNNHTLPLVYIDTKAMRLLLPCSELTDVGGLDDVVVFQIESVVLQPQAINPIGRVIVRPDLYATAERTRTLNIPGADIEDRQYQLDVSGFSLNTGTWQDLDRSLSVGSAFSDTRAALRTMSENPAVQWNYMATGQDSLTPHVTLTSVITRLEVCIVAAPAVIDRRDVLVCGHSFEVNALTDIEVAISTETLLLASKLCSEVIMLVGLILKAPQSIVEVDSSMDVSLSDLLSNEKIINVTDLLTSKDSGLNVDTLSVGSLTAFNRTPECASIQEKSSGYHEDDSLVRGLRNRSPHKDLGLAREKQMLVPLEILLTAGSVSFIMYENIHASSSAFKLVLEQMNMRAKESKSTGKRHPVYFLDEDDTRRASNISIISCSMDNHIQPLLFALLAQPHTFLSRRASEQKMQISFFDLEVRTSSVSKRVESGSLPTRKDFPDVLLETKSGDPHPDTGCPPSFVTSKWIRSGLKSPKLTVEFGRPTKLYCSLDRWTFLQEAVSKVHECLTHQSDHALDGYQMGGYDLAPRFPFARAETSNGSFITILGDDQNSTSVSSENESLLMGLNELGGQNFEGEIAISMHQVVLLVETSAQVQLMLSFAHMSSRIHHPLGRDRITGRVAVKCLTLTTVADGATRLVINPWSCSAGLSIAWEPWLPAKSPPHVQITAESDCFVLELGPAQLACLHKVWREYQQYIEGMVPPSKPSASESHIQTEVPKETAEHESSEHEQYYRDDLRAGAFQFMDIIGSREDLPLPYQVVFWQDPPTMSWRYPQPRALTRVDVFPVPFKVAIPSKHADRQQVFCWLQYWSEVRARFQTYAQFTLSESEVRRLELPGQTVACIWRVQLALSGEDDENFDSARVTINPKTLAACMRVDSFFSPKLIPQFQAALNVSSMQLSLYNHVNGDRLLPEPLGQFAWDGLVPESQGFLTVGLDDASFHVAAWPGKARMLDVSSHFRVDIIDYAYLTRHCVVEPFRARLTLDLDEKASISCVSKPVSIRFGTAAGHTLAVSAQLWRQALREYRLENGPEGADHEEQQVVISRLVVCNDTTGALRFGQCLTDEDILLSSRQCHFYAWRSQKAKPLLRVCLEGAWVWSKPFPVDVDGIESYPLEGSGLSSVVVKVSSLSGTQKQVTVSGQLRLTNLLVEHFECRVVEGDGDMRGERGIVVLGDSTPPSMFLDPAKKAALRIRFNGLETWSGDIPLKPNAKTGQPWLVKVPLQERGQFLCIWCHVVEGTRGSVLAALYPLYSLRSLLPIPATLTIDTPGLNVHLSTVVKGGGAEQQLYCPGTTDHTHRLTLQLESCPPSPSVPLSYAMLERRKTPRPGGDLPDIDEVICALRQPAEPCDWPFAGDDYADMQWVAPVQPQTEILVHYEQRGPYCATLQVQLQPWALILNTLGLTVDLVVDEFTACRIPHQGVLMPPRLEGTFHLAVRSVDKSRTLYTSCALSLHRPGASFYMPRIAGLIPVDGQVPVSILCGYTVVLASLGSRLVPVPDDGAVRVVHVRPRYVVVNATPRDLRVMCVAVHASSDRTTPGLEANVIVPVAPDDPHGHPLVHWSILDDGETELVPYVMVSVGAGWSRPMSVDDGVKRRGFAIPTSEHSPAKFASFVLTAQETNGQTYLTVHPEPHPHVEVHNLCEFDLLVGEESVGGTGGAATETPHLEWNCRVAMHGSAPYSLPSLAKGYPDAAVGRGGLPHLVLALAGRPIARWSAGVDVSQPHEQFVRLPAHGDVRVRVDVSELTSHVSVETVGHVEISAGEIRTRLFNVDADPNLETIFLQDSNNAISVDTTVSEMVDETVGRSDGPSGSGTGSGTDSGTATGTVAGTVGEMLSEMIDDAVTDAVTDKETACKDWRLPTEQSSKLSIVSFLLDPTVIGSKPGVNVRPESRGDSNTDLSLLLEGENPRPERAGLFHDASVTCFVHGLSLTLVETLPGPGCGRTETVAMTLVDVGAAWARRATGDAYELRLSMGDLQMDNQMFQRGGYDFPVLLTRSTPYRPALDGFSLATPALRLAELTSPGAALRLTSIYEGPDRTLTDVKLAIGPFSVYLEDTLLLKFVECLLSFLPGNLALTPANPAPSTARLGVPVPRAVQWGARELAHPVRLHSLSIEPVELLLSVHAYIKLYLALDRSPLTLHVFDRRHIETSYYRLGKVFAMHYIADAIFGAGWVVGSMELLGSPGGLCRTVGSGIKDFVSLPFQGILEGPWGFLMGATHGSASLLRHCAAGAVGSVTGLATSVARNLDCLSLDSEHVQRSEELRRLRPQGIRQGLAQGLSGFGINLLGAVGGIAHHPLQAAMSGNATPRNVAAGVGVGIVGAIVKPLSGAAELVASAGRGLLQGTGWSMLPEARTTPIIEHAFTALNSRLKYRWKLSTGPGVLHVAEATYVTPAGSYEAVALVLTTRALFLVDTEADATRRVLSLSELTGVENPHDPTLLCFAMASCLEGDPDAACRARVVDYVKHSSGHVRDPPRPDELDSTDPVDAPLTFYVNPQARNYFLAILQLAKRQSQGHGFSIL